MRVVPVLRVVLLLALPWLAPVVHATHYKMFVLTGQSNSLGTTNGTEADVSPGSDAADARVKFFWHNVADATISIGSSGGAFLPMQAQQGGYYAGSATHWGPEIEFARTLTRAGVDNIAVVKASRGGGGNTNWSKSAGGHMYAHVVDTVNAAATAMTTAGHTFEIVGLLYIQGESDTAAEADVAGARIKELVDNLRADLPNAANLHGIIGGIASSGTADDTVRVRQAAIADATGYIDYFSNLDLQAQVVPDGLHFNKAAKQRIGQRFAQAMFAAGVVTRRYGKLVFVGDSITQGGNGDHPGYRYQIFKRLAGAGVSMDPATGYQFVGSVTGAYRNDTVTTPVVNGQTFVNVHDGHYGWRASWECARVALPAGRYNTNNLGAGALPNWTGQAATFATADAGTLSYGGTTYIPDTACILIGINDLADGVAETQVRDDIGTMIDQLRAANPNVRIFLNKVLHTNQGATRDTQVNALNAILPALVAAKIAGSVASPVWLVDADSGFTPVTMTYDNIHPNAAGELHVGDRIAAALGLIEEPVAATGPPPPAVEKSSSAFTTRFEGNEIWNGSAYANGWAQTGTLTKSLPESSDLRVVNPGAGGAWIEGTAAGWNTANHGSWTIEVRIRFAANANGFMVWLGTDNDTVLVELYGNRIQDSGANSFNVACDNLDGNFHSIRIAHDAANAKYHVFRDGLRITPLAGVAYDNSNNESRLILGDYTSGTFGNGFDATIDHVRIDQGGAYLPPGLDTDGNGLTDAWEYQYFGVLTGTSPSADPDNDGFSNLQEFQNGTNPVIANTPAVTMPVFILTGAGNARGMAGSSVSHALPPGQHPAEQSGGVWFHDGGGWGALAAAADGSFGPEIAFARLLWDSGYREFGIVKVTTGGGGNSLWHKGSADDSAYQAVVAAATDAVYNRPAGMEVPGYRALLYIQGEENDSIEAADADIRFAALLENLRIDIPNASGMVGILGEIGGVGSDRDTTRTEQLALATSRADIGIARATGLATHNEDGLGSHFNADSLQVMGARFAGEVFAFKLLGRQPLPAWDELHAWYVADHAAIFGFSGEVTRWAAVHQGNAVRDLSRRVSGQVFRNTVTANGVARQVMGFDGTNDLWSNSTTEFGTITTARSIALLCRVPAAASGYLFDGSTGSGRSRAQIRAGEWQAGVAPTGVAWNLAEPTTTPAAAGWQRHVFTYTPNGTNSATTIEHWLDGVLMATVTENEVANLGGLILGSNGGSPFTRLSVEVAEVAVYSKTLNAGEIAALDAAWQGSWGTPTGPPFSVAVSQTPREVARFGSHSVLEIPITAEATGTTTLTGLSLALRESHPGVVGKWRIHSGDSFDSSSVPLAEIPGGVASWSPTFVLPLAEGTNRIYLAAVPERYAPVGATIDAAVDSATFSGARTGPIVPGNPDPAGVLTLGLVPMVADVRRSGEGGVTTYRIPGIACDSNGVLHAVYDHRYNGGADLPANIDVGYARSMDGGMTWSASRVILDFDASEAGSSGNGVGDPCILHDPATGTLWVAALWSFGNHGYVGSGPGTDPSQTGQYVLTKSTDGGLTWSAPINITTAVKDDVNWRLVFQGPGHGLALRDGTLVFPSQRINAAGVVQSCSVFSTDHGATWDFGSAVSGTSPQTNENTVCELDDGRLLFSMRTPSGSNGQRAWAHYTPGGDSPMRDGSWSSIYRLPVVTDPVCQGSVIQWMSTHRGHARERVVYVGPGTSASRSDLTLRVSGDGGLTWPVSRLLYAGPSAYSSVCVLPDNSLGIFFEADNYTRMRFMRVEEEWVFDPGTDLDGDLMPDAWEDLHGVSDPDADDDGDGRGNLAEYRSGTDPQNRASCLRATGIAHLGDRLRFDWAGVTGRTYVIETSGDLVEWTPAATARASGADCSVLLDLEDEARLFVRAAVLP